MWTIKYFKTEQAQERWIEANAWRYQFVRLFVNNGYAIEFKKLRRIIMD